MGKPNPDSLPGDEQSAQSIQLKERHTPREGQRTRWKLLLGAAIVLLLLAAVYFFTARTISLQMESAYAGGDCARLVRLAAIGHRLRVPAAMPSSASAFGHEPECSLYSGAARAQEEGRWDLAYEAYTQYLADFPSGALASEAAINRLSALTEWAEQEVQQSRYAEAASHLTTLVHETGATGNDNAARALLADCYLQWAKGLQAAHDYEDALAKLELSIQTDPALDGSAGSAAQARLAIPELQLQWADALSKAGDFESAVTHMETALSAAAPQQRASFSDSLARLHLQWAEGLASEGDFMGALSRIEVAESGSLSSGVASEAENTTKEIYADLAASSGSQARALMEDAAAAFVAGEPLPEMPVFGVDADHERVYVYPSSDLAELKDSFSEDVVPRSPGEMQYVAKLYEVSEVAGRCGGFYLDTSELMPQVVTYQYSLFVRRWVLEVFDLQTGEMLEKQGFAGKAPVCTDRSRDDLVGGPPSVDELNTWLLQFVK